MIKNQKLTETVFNTFHFWKCLLIFFFFLTDYKIFLSRLTSKVKANGMNKRKFYVFIQYM